MKLKALSRLGVGLLVAVATSAVLHAMTSHEANLYSDGTMCDAFFDTPTPNGGETIYRRLIIWLYGPGGQLLASNYYGSFNDSEPFYVAAIHSPNVGAGTYTCHVWFEEKREYGNYTTVETDDWYDSVEVN